MASQRLHNGGGTGPFIFDFPSLQESDIKVSVGGNPETGFTINNYDPVTGGEVNISGGTATGTDNERIFRQTEPETLAATFVTGSSISANDLNNCNKQTIFLADENRTSINNLALGNAASAVLISGSNIADNSISSTKIIDLEVKTADIDDLAVTTAKIADDAITADKLANSINTNITAASFTTGMIMMFTGSSAPSGWAFCDGNNGTPDLRDKFIVGAGTTYSSGDTGGSDSVTLNINQMPQHDHTLNINTSTTNLNGTVTAISETFEVSGSASGVFSKQSASGSRTPITSDTSGAGQFSFNGTHYHSISGHTGANGSTGAHENRPPYYALSYIMKL